MSPGGSGKLCSASRRSKDLRKPPWPCANDRMVVLLVSSFLISIQRLERLEHALATAWRCWFRAEGLGREKSLFISFYFAPRLSGFNVSTCFNIDIVSFKGPARFQASVTWRLPSKKQFTASFPQSFTHKTIVSAFSPQIARLKLTWSQRPVSVVARLHLTAPCLRGMLGRTHGVLQDRLSF